MNEKKFDPKKLQKLNDPRRLTDIPPEYICDRLAVKRPEVVVEIGAGTAFFSVAFLQQLKPSVLYACDISEIMIDWMSENILPNHQGIVAVRSEEQHIPLDDSIADLVFMINLHHELDNPLQTLEESFRLLKPGGEIFIVDWQKRDMPEGPPEHIRYHHDQVRDDMIKAGFGQIAIFNEMSKHFLVVGKKDHHDR